MRTTMISFRVEPETARGLTWLVNKFNYENNASLTKTDIMELLIKASIKDEDLIALARCITGAEGAGESYEIYIEGVKSSEQKDYSVTSKDVSSKLAELLQNAWNFNESHVINVQQKMDGLSVYYAISIDENRYTLYQKFIESIGLEEAVYQIVNLFNEDSKGEEG